MPHLLFTTGWSGMGFHLQDSAVARARGDILNKIVPATFPIQGESQLIP